MRLEISNQMMILYTVQLGKNDELLVNRCEQLTKRGSFNCTSVNFETVGMIEDVHMMAARVID